MSHFDRDHAVALLRGIARLDPGRVRRALAELVAFVSTRVEERIATGGSPGAGLNELRAVVQALEVFNERYPSRESSFEEVYLRKRERLMEKRAPR
jgi:hypothetical protein